MKKKEFKIVLNIEETVSILISTFIPAVVTFFTLQFGNGSKNDTFLVAIATLLSAIISLILTLFLPNFFATCKRFRTLSDLEGRWLQIIPKMKERPYSVFELKYNKKLKRYEIHGMNYGKKFDHFVRFNSYQIIERFFQDGFYYITDHTLLNSNGLGKVCFKQSEYDKYTRAEGYFFDATNNNCSEKFDFMLIKCDDKLHSIIESGKSVNKDAEKSVNSESSDVKNSSIEEMSHEEVLRYFKDFADKEIVAYNKRIRAINCKSNCPYKG